MIKSVLLAKLRKWLWVYIGFQVKIVFYFVIFFRLYETVLHTFPTLSNYSLYFNSVYYLGIAEM